MKCRPGDLAIVIAATNTTNLGLVVRVLRPHDNSTDIRWRMNMPCWLVECRTPLIWGSPDTEWVRETVGPVPDAQLQPIRGLPSHQGATEIAKHPRAVTPCTQQL